MYYNPQYEKNWKIVADKQYQESIQRQNLQKTYKNQIKQKYLKQLSQQIQQKQKAIQQQRKLQTHIDKLQVSKKIENQKRIIQIQKLKQSMIQQKNNLIDHQNLFYEKKKRQKQKEIKQLQKSIQNIKISQAEQRLRFQKQQQLKKKQYFRKSLLQTIQQRNQAKKEQKIFEQQIEKYKLYELENILQKNDSERAKELSRLKQRAKKVDYGSHSLFEQNKNKSLKQRKAEQWLIYKDSIQRQQQLKLMQQQQRIGKKMMLNYYQNQLKHQINEREQINKMTKIQQLQKQKYLAKQSEYLNLMFQNQNRNLQMNKKKQLYEYLKKQEQMKRNQKMSQKGMKQQQLKINLNTIINSKNSQIPQRSESTNYKGRSYSTLDPQVSQSLVLSPISYKPTPGDTFRLDASRLKQFQILNKSLRTSQQKPVNVTVDLNNRNHRYFASKGLNVLY